ncbi:MAG: hypothetical protein ACOC7Q_02185 [bacterium]|jgi:hypothetical protein
MSATSNTKKVVAPPEVVVRRSVKRVAVTTEMKLSLRANARESTRTDFPELPGWRRTGR